MTVGGAYLFRAKSNGLMVARGDDLGVLQLQINEHSFTVFHHVPVITVVGVDCGNGLPTVLMTVVFTPFHVGGTENGVLFSDFFDVVVGVFEVEQAIGRDLVGGRETRGQEGRVDVLRVKPVLKAYLSHGQRGNEDGTKAGEGDGLKGA